MWHVSFMMSVLVCFLPELLPELLCQLVHDGMTVVLNSLE